MARRKKQTEEPIENQDNINKESDDNFGLPEVEYEPLNREEPQAETEASTTEEPIEEPQSTSEPVVEEEKPVAEEEYVYTSPYEEEEKSSPWPIILGVLLVLLIIAGGVWWFMFEKPKRDALALEKARQEQAAQADAARKQHVADSIATAEADQRRADSLANLQPKEGVIEALTERTGKYYIVVASAIDDDLLMDYATKLSKKGVNTKIIPPFGKTKFSRIAVDSRDTYAEAQSTADGMKGGDYGSEIWVVHY